MSKGKSGTGDSNAAAVDKLAGEVAAMLRNVGFINDPDLLAIKELIAKFGVGADGLRAINAQAITEVLKQRLQPTAGSSQITSALNLAMLVQADAKKLRSLSVAELQSVQHHKIAQGNGPIRRVGATGRVTAAAPGATAAQHTQA